MMDDEDDEYDDGLEGGFEDGDNGVIESIDRDEDIKALWKKNARDMDDAEKEAHEKSYHAKTKSESLVDLRAAAEKKTHLIEEGHKGSKKKLTVYQKQSLASMGLAAHEFREGVVTEGRFLVIG